MMINGHVVPDAAIEYARGRMLSDVVFQFSDVQEWLRRKGTPLEVSDRAADRILQMVRKAGLIRHAKGKWRWIGGHA